MPGSTNRVQRGRRVVGQPPAPRDERAVLAVVVAQQARGHELRVGRPEGGGQPPGGGLVQRGVDPGVRTLGSFRA
jgi:hypothetical protein